MYMAPEVFKEMPYSEKVGHGMILTAALSVIVVAQCTPCRFMFPGPPCPCSLGTLMLLNNHMRACAPVLGNHNDSVS